MVKRAASTKATTKTSARPKKAPATTTRTAKQATETKQSTASAVASNSAFRFRRSYVLVGIIFVVLGLLLWASRGLFFVASVNGSPVSRFEVIRELEKRGGKQVADQLIVKALIRQESRKRNVSVSDEEVQKELKNIEKRVQEQGQKLEDALAAQGMTREGLVEDIRTEKLLEKMVGKVAVTDKEVTDYIASNKDSLPENAQASQVKDELLAQKLGDKKRKLVEKLQKDANITYFVTY